MSANTFTITGKPLRPHEYIVVKREMNAGDEAWITNHSATIGGTKKKPEVNLTLGDIKLATLKRMIVSWNLTTEDENSGQQVPIPLCEQAIEGMPRRISAYVNKIIDELNPEEEESDEDFPGGANGSSTTSSHPEKLVPLKP
jgi:hypothetical protein